MAKSKKTQSKRSPKRAASKRSPKRAISKKTTKRSASKKTSKRKVSKASKQRAYARRSTTTQCTTFKSSGQCGGHPSCIWTADDKCRRRSGVLQGTVYKGPVLPAPIADKPREYTEEEKAYIRSIGGKAFF